MYAVLPIRSETIFFLSINIKILIHIDRVVLVNTTCRRFVKKKKKMNFIESLFHGKTI